MIPFSFDTDPATVQREQVSCWLTHTGSEVKRLIEENIDRSPLYNGGIHGTGPRYCPSIEDKVMKISGQRGTSDFLLSRRVCIPMRCISEVCPLLFPRMSNMR